MPDFLCLEELTLKALMESEPFYRRIFDIRSRTLGSYRLGDFERVLEYEFAVLAGVEVVDGKRVGGVCLTDVREGTSVSADVSYLFGDGPDACDELDNFVVAHIHSHKVSGMNMLTPSCADLYSDFCRGALNSLSKTYHWRRGYSVEAGFSLLDMVPELVAVTVHFSPYSEASLFQVCRLGKSAEPIHMFNGFVDWCAERGLCSEAGVSDALYDERGIAEFCRYIRGEEAQYAFFSSPPGSRLIVPEEVSAAFPLVSIT